MYGVAVIGLINADIPLFTPSFELIGPSPFIKDKSCVRSEVDCLVAVMVAGSALLMECVAFVRDVNFVRRPNTSQRHVL